MIEISIRFDIDRPNIVPLIDEAPGQMGSDKSGSAADEYFHLSGSSFCLRPLGNPENAAISRAARPPWQKVTHSGFS
jgi:hypothetical protein